tara:strand:- start:1275 stop:2228 length:954 start_codon:yes stop_codon:yes gene_type:complete
MKDLRHRESRKDAFIEWATWSLTYKDCDPALWLLNYLFDRYEHNIEQKYWIAWIYGTTYHLPTAWIIWNEFPDFELVDYDRICEWNNDNYKRLRYQTDTKWNKGHLPAQYKSYHDWVHYKNPTGNQRDKFAQFKDFRQAWNNINLLHKFGRYSTWFYMQTLKECVGVPLEPSNLVLRDMSGSRSHRNGLCYAVGLDEWVNQKLNMNQIHQLEMYGSQIRSEINAKGFDMDFYEMETLLCSFKKIFRTSHGRYLGYYLDRQAEEIKKVEADGWYGIDWEVFWDGRRETLEKKLSKSKSIRKDLYGHFLETGNLDYGTV